MALPLSFVKIGPRITFPKLLSSQCPPFHHLQGWAVRPLAHASGRIVFVPLGTKRTVDSEKKMLEVKSIKRTDGWYWSLWLDRFLEHEKRLALMCKASRLKKILSCEKNCVILILVIFKRVLTAQSRMDTEFSQVPYGYPYQTTQRRTTSTSAATSP